MLKPRRKHPGIKKDELMQTPRKHLRKVPAKSRAVRKIPKSSKWHFVGELVYDDIDGNPQRLGFGSYHEFKAAICLIYRDDFADIEEQLASLPFKTPGGNPSCHFFDFRFTTLSGQRICVSVKPERIAKTYTYKATIKAVADVAIGNICDGVATVTDRNISPVEFHNAELFHAARKPEPEIDQLIVQALGELDAGLYFTAVISPSRAGSLPPNKSSGPSIPALTTLHQPVNSCENLQRVLTQLLFALENFCSKTSREKMVGGLGGAFVSNHSLPTMRPQFSNALWINIKQLLFSALSGAFVE